MAKKKDEKMCECGKGAVKEVKSSMKMDGTPRKPNMWVQFVNDYAISKGITYASALGEYYDDLKKEYAKSKKMPKKPRAKKAVKTAMPVEMPMAEMPMTTSMPKKRKVKIVEKITEKM
jgi:hypothetical protein